MAPAGSRTGRREEVSLFDKVVENWELYHTLRADQTSMGDERIRLYELANAATGAERFRILDQVQTLEERISAISGRMKELLNFVEDNVEEARHEAQRSLRGSRRDEAMEKIEGIQVGLIDIHAEEEEMRRQVEQIARLPEVSAGATREAVPARAEEAPPEEMPTAAAGPVLSPEFSTSYRTMMRWYRKLLELEEDNGRRMARLERDEREGNTRSANIQRKKIDENVEEMVQLMANISRSLTETRDEEESSRHTRELENILATWNERQQHLLDAMAARGEPPEAMMATYEAAKYLCTNSMDDVLSMLLGSPYYVAYGREGTAAPPAPTAARLPQPTPVPPQMAVLPQPVAAGGPVEVPEGETYFEYLNERTGRRYRILIRGEDLNGMSTEEVYARVQELVQDPSISWGRLFGRKREKDGKIYFTGGMLAVQRIGAGGTPDYWYHGRSHLRDNFFAQQLGWTPGAVAPVAPPAVAEVERPLVAAEVPPTVAEVVPAPIAAPPAEAAHDATWARDMHDSIISRFPPLREFARERDAAREAGREYERQAEMDRFLAELVRDYVTFRNDMPGIRNEMEAQVRSTGIGIQVLDEMNRLEERMGRDGRRIAETVGMSARDLVAFAESYFAGIPAPAAVPPAPAAPEAAEVERPPAVERPPVTAPPAVVPPVAAPPVAAPPVEAAPALTQERAAEVAFNYMRMLVSEPEARRISEYVSGRRAFGRLEFSSEETATRVFDVLNTYIQRFRLNPLVLVREEGKLVLTDAPRAPRTETIIEDLARDNMNFTEEVAAWAVDQYNDVHPDFPVAVEGWFTPTEIFQRGRMIEILSSSLFRALRSMNNARYRVDRGRGMETVDAYDFGADFVFDRLGRHKVELSEAEAMVGQFSNEDIQVLFAWVASCFTGNHENLYDNLMHAVDPSHETADPNYSGMRMGNANLAYYNDKFEEFMAALPSDELRAAVDYNAFILGAMIRTYYVRQYGEPATEEAAAQLDTACINAGRVIILGQMRAEMGENWYETFTYNGQEYMLGTHLLTRPTGQGIMIDGQVRGTLLVLPTADPLEVRVVGYRERGRTHLLREGGGDAVANVRLEETPEGESYIPHHVSGRDSLGNGLTALWCYPSPGYLFGERMRGPPEPYEDILAPPYTGLGAEYEDVAPPTVSRTAYQELTIGGQFGLEQRGDYNRGERIDDAFAVIQNPTIGADEASMNPISFEDLFKEPNVWIEFNNFRRVAEGEDHYYATMAPEVARDYADMFENAEEIQHVAELRNGRVYIYVNAEGKIVDALSDAAREDVHGLPPEGQEWLYSFTLGRDENDFPVIMRAMLDVPAEYRRLIMARVPSYELRTRMAESDRIAYDSMQNRVEVELTTAYQVRAGAFDTERILPYAEFSTGPVYMRTEALRGPLGDMFREETARLAELHGEFDLVADSSKRTTSSEEERAAERRLAEILIERREIYDRMLAETEAAIGTAAGEERRVLEGFRDAINANLEAYFPGMTAESLRAYIASTGENYYSHAYMQARWDELQALHLEFNRLSANYYAVPEENVAERDRIATEGWRLVLRRRELYEEMLGHIDTSTVANEESLAAVNAYRAQIEANFAQHMADVDYAALREEFGR